MVDLWRVGHVADVCCGGQTYPLLFLISAGVVMLTSTGVRHLTRCPDVKVNREIRKHPELALKDDEAWRSHRKVIANMAKNPVNTRSFFD